MQPWRLTVHGVSADGKPGRDAERKIAAALEDFLETVEKIDGHGVYLAQFEGSKDFVRLRGEDTTLVESPEALAAADDEPPTYVDRAVRVEVTSG